jgi:scyllo-inositol 2-dehydrogenase (NADP+)
MPQESPIKVGIIGLGRAGWGLHAVTMQQPVVAPKYKVVAATDPITQRMEEAQATFGCRTYGSVEALLADKEVELVVVASLNDQHAAHSIAALKAGKDVLCEKPMATSLADADAMLATAKQTGRILTFDHCGRFEPAFQKVREIIASGVLGEVILIHLNSHSFRRRWDWQTLKQFGGGEMNNNASHSVDEALQFMGDIMPKVTCDLRRTPLCAGDAEDHVKIVLTAPGVPTVDIEVSNSVAMREPHFQISGTYGGLSGGHDQLQWRYFDPTKVVERTADPKPTPDRSYNHEDLPWQEESWTAPKLPMASYVGVYLSLYETMRHSAPLAITPESVHRVIAILEECRRQSSLYSA